MAALAIGLQDGADLIEITDRLGAISGRCGVYGRNRRKNGQECEENFYHLLVILLIRQRHGNAYSVVLTG